MKCTLVIAIVALAALTSQSAHALDGLRIRLETDTTGTFVVRAKPTATVASIMELVEDTEGLPRAEQLLYHDDRVLRPERLLSDYDIQDNGQIFIATTAYKKCLGQ